MAKTRKKQKMTLIVHMHYVKLVLRSLLFLTATGVYVFNHIMDTGMDFGGLENDWWIMAIIWLFFVVDMLLRFFPSRFESMGCQKVFACNYKPRYEKPAPRPSTWKSTLAVAAAWLALNGLIGFFYCIGVISKGVLFLISLAYSVCDIICILFFCPFQTWFMKNKCCTTCRIYNWDYAMMFTPLVFIRNFYTWSLLGLAIALLLKWELTLRRHPEYFFEVNNCSLDCSQCQEKLCHHKKQLRSFLKKNRA